MEHLVTKEKLQQLKEEVQILKSENRKDIAKRLKRAKELGDLSENSEYFEAREAQEQLEKRIFQLEQMISNAKIIKMTRGKSTVDVGATIEVSTKGKKMKFTIVGASETDPSKGYISNESPLGSSFIGKKAGDSVVVQTPAGKTTYKIEKIN